MRNPNDKLLCNKILHSLAEKYELALVYAEDDGRIPDGMDWSCCIYCAVCAERRSS